MTTRFARWLLILLLVIGGSVRVFAQQYPVQVNTFIMPPYSVYLSDYVAPDANNLTVTLNLGDLDFTQYQCKLRLTIEGGNGVLIQTLLGYSPAPITLTGGVPETLYGYDIRQYFNPDNLEFSGIPKSEFLRTGKLPEGFYTFTIEVLDYHRNVVVSNTSLANAWLVLNDPPLINLPFNGEKVRATDPQNIMFSWTPRHTASPNAAFSTEYKFKLVEIYPVGRNPNDAILTSNSIYETTTSATALNYGIIEPLLIPGRQYAFQLQAYDIDGRDLFKNNGRSEVYTFQYGDACLAPEGTDADALDPDRLKFSWEPSELHTEFKLRFRQANKDDWYEQQTFNTSLIVPDLIPNTTYEYQVMGSCGSIEGEYSEVGSVTTPETDEDAFACGAASTDFELNTEPLPFPLVPPMNIETADFRVAVKEVFINPDGTYSGTGWAMIPWFEMATVRVKFNGIRVNKDFRVYQGNITTIYSNNSQFVMGDDLNELDEDGITGEEDEEIEDPLDDFYDDYDFEDTVKVDYDISDVYTDEDGDIVIVYEDANGDQQEEHIEAGEGDILIEDGNGDQWAIDQDGNVEENPNNTPDPVDPADVDYLVTFKPNPEQRYGFDAKGDYSMGPYDEIEINGQEYVVAWKSVELGRNDYVNVVTEKDNFPSEVGFQTPTGKASSITSASANEKQVVVTGTTPGLEETLDAYVVVEEGEETEELVLGRLNVKTYEQLSERLVIVPVNNAATPNPEEIATALNDIYKQAVVEWRLSIADRFEIDSDMIDGMMDEVSGIFSSFPYPIREFNQAFRDRASQYDDNAYYIFLVEGAHANKAGFMPFKRQFGYIFTDELGSTTIAKAIAHELGHGAFRLRHTFSPEDFKAQEGTTDNLMDYTNGTRLKKAQWDLIHEPGEMNGWFEGDEESAMGEEDIEARYAAFLIEIESIIQPDDENDACWIRAKDKAWELVTSDKWYLTTYGSLIEYLLCKTEESNCTGSYEEEFMCGFTNALIQELDFVSLVELFDIIKTLAENRNDCLFSNLKFNVIGTFDRPDEMYDEIMRCTLGFTITPDEVQQAREVIENWVQQVWTDPYEQGQATEMLLTMFVPFGKVNQLKKLKLLEKVKSSSKYAKASSVMEIVQSQTNGNVDDLVRVLNASTAKGIARFSQYDNLLVKLDELDMITPGSKDKFFQDFSEAVDDVVRELGENPGLVDGWKKMDNLGADDAVRRNPKAMEVLDLKAKSLFEDILHPSEYLSAEYIDMHLAKFDEGAVRFTTDAYPTLGTKEAFVMSKSEFDDLMAVTGGDLSLIEAELALNPGTLTGDNAVIAWIKKEDFKDFRIPSGKEKGADPNLWIPGGKTAKTGWSEAVMDLSDGNIPRVLFPF